jgi:hypothetical protein
MLQERRYTCYKQADIWLQLAHYQVQLKVKLVRNSATSNSVSLMRLDTGKQYHAIILARSSDWYKYSLNAPQWEHGITACVCGTHDSCLPVPVLALDTMRWYEEKKMRDIFGPLQPKLDSSGKLVPDTFDKARKSHYGHNMFIGALMCGREDARTRLNAMNERTRYRIEAEVRALHHRRRGRPLALGAKQMKDK